ncbi:hypothetical protein G6F24_011188 [Rhizopus arrhizus]|nr:hypothetical protein G6F24_011188 [Rhizopus arrhizus]
MLRRFAGKLGIDWSMNGKWSWCAMEIISPIVFITSLYFTRPTWTPFQTLLASAWIIHYTNRSIIYPLRANSMSPIHVFTSSSSVVFNFINGYTNGMWIGRHSQSTSTQFWVGLFLWLIGFLSNIYHDSLLFKLREKKDKTKRYFIPQGGLFRYVSCPNYLSEIIEWTGYALASWPSLPALIFAGSTAANLMPRAWRTHACSSSTPTIQEAKHPEVLVFKNYTPLDLLPFDGNGKEGRILMAVNGSIYDVTRGRNFYGPGGPYANFAGHDASRGLAKNSFDLDMLTDPKESIDKLEDLSADEWESLREWEQHFASKYLLVELPDELQIKIFSELPLEDLLKSTVVCRKWNKLVFDGSLWSKINIIPFYKTIPTDYLLKLIKASSGFLKIANFRGCIQFNGHALRVLSEHCPNVQVMIINGCRNLSAASITCFLQRAHQLRVLDVSGLDTVKNSTLAINSLSRLEKINLSWCRNITGQGLVPLVTSCSSSLRYLKIDGCPQLDDATMETFGRHMPNLTHLSLAACTSLTDTGLLSFLSIQKTKITHLNLSSCARLTDATLRHLSQYTPHLTHLELSGCVLMTDQGFCYLSSRVKSLVHLDLEDLQQITGITVRAIANHQTDLQRFCLSNCTQISDDAITHLILHGVCHKLQHLELDNCTVTDEVLNTIAVFLQSQKRIQSESLLLTDSGISLFSQRERQINLKVLDCLNITESGVKNALAKASPMLTIKSFYSFQENTSATTLNTRQVGSVRGMNNTTHRQSGNNSTHTANNCIIL